VLFLLCEFATQWKNLVFVSLSAKEPSLISISS